MSYLSERAAKRVAAARAGIIRPGVRRLTRAALEHPRAKEIEEIFLRADRGEMRFEEAQKMIEKRTGLANSMHPSNAPYFSVFATDFTVPEHAKMILEKYGEDRGDGKRLYRFPIVFQTSDIDRIMPGGFRRSKGEPEYFSTQGQDGVRYCTYYEHVTPEQIQAQRRQRVIQVRPEPKIRGQCDPGKCTEFADGSCRFVGELSFYIPGIPAGGLMKLTTGSEYACEEMYMELARIKEALGTIPQVHPFLPGEPTFMITKKLQPRTYYDQRSGERKRTENWVPILVPNFDMGALISAPRRLTGLVSAPQAWLASSGTDGIPADVGVPQDQPNVQTLAPKVQEEEVGEIEPPMVDHDDDQKGPPPEIDDGECPSMSPDREEPVASKTLEDYLDLGDPQITSWIAAVGGQDAAFKLAAALSGLGKGVLQAHIAISKIVRESGITKDEFQAYMTHRYGNGWARNAKVYLDTKAHMEAMAKDGSLITTIRAVASTGS